jgi:asparagine synthase (glutamine-hydrolysing)
VREVDPGDFGVVRDLVRHYGEPYSDASMLPTYLLSRFAREHVKTALSGDGADELFGGYNRYLVMAAFRGLDLVPLSWRRALSRLLQALLPARREERTVGSQVRRLAELLGSSGEADRYLDLISRFPESLKQRVYGERLAGVDLTESQALMRQAFADLLSWDPRSRVAQVDVGTYLPGDILTKVDIASMAASLEVRSPFLDHRLAEFAWSLPWSLKQRLPLSRKRVIRHAVADWLPREVVTCGKLGFGVPLARWFRGRWQEHLRDVLLGHTARERGILDARAVECLIREHVDGVTDHSYSLWALLVLELWFQEAGVS